MSSKIALTFGVISCNETAAAVVYILVLGCPGQSKWKLSKAMESNLEAEKEIFKEQDKLNAECNEYSEAKLKMKNIKPKSVKDLQKIFYPNDKQCQSNLSRNLSTLALQENKGECLDYEPRWVRLICMTSYLKHICLSRIWLELDILGIWWFFVISL